MFFPTCYGFAKPKTDKNKWYTFTSPNSDYIVDFPHNPQEIKQESSIYVSKDDRGNLFAIQEFIPPEDLAKSQNAKEKLQTAIKILVLKKNTKLAKTNYLEYKGNIVAVDFVGEITTNQRNFRGRIILEKNKLYYLFSILMDDSTKNITNYTKFINSFKIN